MFGLPDISSMMNTVIGQMSGAMGGMGGGGGGGGFAPNPLSSIDQAAYHFRLYALPDSSAIQLQNGDYAALDNSMILAETGSSEVNITEVTLTNMISPNVMSKNNNLSGMTLKITEPLGATMLDRMSEAGSATRSQNWMKTLFALELKFHGYNLDGSYSPDAGVGRTWVFSLKLLGVEVDITEGGAKYELTMAAWQDTSLLQHFGVLGNGYQTPAVGTVGEAFEQLKQKLQNDQLDEYGTIRHLYNFVLHPVPSDGDALFSGDPSSWQLVSMDDSEQFERATDVGGMIGQTHLQSSPIDTISSVTTAILSNTLEAQQLATRSMDPTRPSNGAFNAVLWKVVGDFKLREDDLFDSYDNDYNYIITYHIVPHITNNGMLSVEQRNDAENQSIVEAKREALLRRGRLAKEYHYLFSGVNTEVISTDLKLNFSNFARTPRATENTTMASVPPMLGDEQVEINQLQQLRELAVKLRETMTSMGGGTLEMQQQYSDLNRQIYQLGGSGGGTVLPQSSDRENKRTRLEEMGDAESNVTSGKSNYRMILTQILGVMPALMEINITIRGDPYWLGPNPMDGFGAGGGNVVEPHTGDNVILFNMILPAGVGGDGAPILMPSNMFSGMYIVKTISHTFSGGKFVQTLGCIRDTNAIIVR